MDSKKVEDLLNRYWECETSLDEERALREYFQGGDIPEHHKEAAALFRYFSNNERKSISDDSFDQRVVHSVSHKPKSKVIQLVYNSMRIAAGIGVLLAAIYFVRTEIRKNDPVAVEDTYSDPKLAFEETKKALLMISKGFTKAEQEARKINMFNEAQEEVQKEDSDKTSL